jgi:hypothetical protein
MKMSRMLAFALAVCAPGLISFGQGKVSNPAKRQATLDLAGRLLAPRENPAAALPAALVNPFNPAATRKSGDNKHVNASDHDILENIATRITPSGMMLLGGSPILLFREKKLKVGDSLTNNFEGTDYVVVITEINPTSFKVRLNREEITRPIKPGKAP